jgi:HSP20 family protein|tara:strand:- start:7815 stop:8231 length:417 start_codon:yes stop_codon:yes gene_type:complete
MSLLKRPTLFDLIIRDTQNQLFSDIDRNGLSNTSVYAPSVNTYRTGNDLTFEVAAPGYNKQGLNVSVDRNVLTIQGDANTEDREGAIRTEYETTSFTRTFTLPSDVDASTLTARYNDGILTVNASLLDSSKTLNINIE